MTDPAPGPAASEKQEPWEPPCDPRRPYNPGGDGPRWPLFVFIGVMTAYIFAMIFWSWAMDGWR